MSNLARLSSLAPRISTLTYAIIMMEAENPGNLVCVCQSYQIQLFYKEASIVMALRELKQAKQPIYCLHKGVVMITVFLIDYPAYPSLDSRITSPLQVR